PGRTPEMAGEEADQIGVAIGKHGIGGAVEPAHDFFFSSRRRHTSLQGGWSSDVCSSDLQTAAAIRRIDADVGAVQPVATGLVRREPASLNQIRERVVDVVEIEMQSKRRRRADNAVAVEDDELSVGKQIDVFQIVGRLEALGIRKRWKAGALQLLELLRVLGARLQNRQAVRELAEVPHDEGSGGLARAFSAPRAARSPPGPTRTAPRAPRRARRS